MNTKWTPGPYVLHIEKDGGNWRYEVQTVKPHNPAGGLGKHIATVNPSALLYPEHTGRLLAAAPAMYEALEAVFPYVEDEVENFDTPYGESIRAIRAALAAARGEVQS